MDRYRNTNTNGDQMGYMKMALKLAEKGCGFVNPNPMVGAVIVKNGKIIGSGYHEKYGLLHAERNAIASCAESPVGADLYVTLEPCCHHGKTPPCTEAILQSGIKRVFVGSVDPNPLVSGKGLEILKENNIEVASGILDDENKTLNEVFFHYMKTGKPFVVMKYAMTVDGKIATFSGKSKWITGEEAREHVHHSRHQYSGIMTGVNTVIVDNPMLNCRIPEGLNGTRIICDTSLRMPIHSQIVESADEITTYLATASEDEERIKEFESRGCRIIKTGRTRDGVDLNDLMLQMGEAKIDSILLEGGSTLNYSALASGIVNKLQVYISPKIFGGEEAKTPVGGAGIENPDNAFILKNRNIKLVGEDILMEYEVMNHVYRNY